MKDEPGPPSLHVDFGSHRARRSSNMFRASSPGTVFIP